MTRITVNPTTTSTTNTWTQPQTYSVGVASAEAIQAKSSSTTANAVSIKLDATTGTGAALSVVSENEATSSLEVTGHEKGRGTVKASHVNSQTTRTADESASACSLDLQGKAAAENGAAGSLAQGLVINKTTFDIFNDVVFTSTSKNISSASAVFTKEDVGREVKNIPVGVKTSGKDVISAFVSATEVTLEGEAAKETKTPAGVEIGRAAGAWVTVRDPAKKLIYRLKSSGIMEHTEVLEDPTTVEGWALYVKNKKLFLKLGASAATEITVP